MSKVITVEIEKIDNQVVAATTQVLNLDQVNRIYWQKEGSVMTATSISKAAAAVVTSAGHGLANGDLIYLTGAAGGDFTTLNDTQYVVTVTGVDTFTIPVDTSLYSGSYTASSATFQKEETIILAWQPIDQGIREYKYQVTETFAEIDALKEKRLLSATVTHLDSTVVNWGNGKRAFISPNSINVAYIDKLIIEAVDNEDNMVQYKCSAIDDNDTCFNFDMVTYDIGQAGYNEEIEIPVERVYNIQTATNSILIAWDFFQGRHIQYTTSLSAANVASQVTALGI